MVLQPGIKGMIFDIKEFSVNDGPGVRQTVFLKGCPLRCNWCHNPEGISMQPQLMVRYGECAHCGACGGVCGKEECDACGACVPVCPLRLRGICGEEVLSSDLAVSLLVNAPIYAQMDGGVTFSGGEPLMQPAFLLDTVKRLNGVHIALETCGYAAADVFLDAVKSVDLVMMDLKLMDPAQHKTHCGTDNAPILQNLEQLKAGGTPFLIRVPLIPGVTDTEGNLQEIAKLLQGAKMLEYVELLPYNRLAGAKYGKLGLEYVPNFDTERPLMDTDGIFEGYGIESRLM